MSNYTKSTNFASKDTLPTGNALKIVKGTELDTEFNNIATAVATKADSSGATLSSPTITSPTITGGSVSGLATDMAVPDGGTGASSFTSGGLIRGNGTSALSVASAADIVAAIGSTAVANATAATTATSAGTVTTTVASAAVGTTQANNDNSTKIATTEYVQNMTLGQGQTWQNVLASRSTGTTYTNSTGRPIVVMIGFSYATTQSDVYLDSVQIGSVGSLTSGTAGSQTLTLFVRAGGTYRLTTGVNVVFWTELR